MLRTIITFTGIAALVTIAAFFGCSKQSASPAPKATATIAPESAPAAADKPAAPDTAATAAEPDPKIVAALASLSVEDRALAEKQKVCPVSGEPLGMMGAPKKLDVKGQAVFICCEGCEEKLLANPDEYLAKLNK